MWSKLKWHQCRERQMAQKFGTFESHSETQSCHFFWYSASGFGIFLFFWARSYLFRMFLIFHQHIKWFWWRKMLETSAWFMSFLHNNFSDLVFVIIPNEHAVFIKWTKRNFRNSDQKHFNQLFVSRVLVD